MAFQYEVIDHVQLAAPRGSEDQARAFYQQILGFEEIQKPALLQRNGGTWFQAGSVQIHIGVEEPFQPAKKAHPAIRVKNIEALKSYLTKHDVFYSADHKLPGAHRFYVNDPFGNRIEFLEWIY